MSHDMHITRSILRALDRGELALHDLYRLARHLTTLCPECRRAVEGYRKEEAGPALSDRVAAVVERASRLEARVRSDEARSRRLVERLRLLTPENRIAHVAALDPAPGPTFLEQLLDEVQSHLTEDPSRALAWAELAIEAIEHVADPLPSQHVLALAARANALRAFGQHKRAGSVFLEARELAHSLAVDDLHVAAELDCLQGALHRDLGGLDAAEELLTRAVRTFEELGDRDGAARTLIKLLNLEVDRCAFDAAFEHARGALALLSPTENPRLYLYARYNMAYVLVAAEEYQEAFDYLEWDRNLHREHADRHLFLRLSWLHGRIAAGTDQPEAAERHLLHTRDGFAELGIGFDAALVSLDLALLYHHQGRLDDVKHAAIDAAYLFQQHAVHREALAALTMLRDAALEERATAANIERIAAFLRTAARDPRARFAPPN